MFLRLCGPPSIPLSFNLAVVLPRWITYRFRLATDCLSPTVSYHRLLRGLPGYLILFDPHACLLRSICEKFGFTSLGYQSIDGLLKAIGIDRDKICTYCWTGKE